MSLVSNIYGNANYMREHYKDYKGKKRKFGDKLELPKPKKKSKKPAPWYKNRPKKDHTNHEMLVLPGKGPHVGQLKCKECGTHIQWLSQHDYDLLKR